MSHNMMTMMIKLPRDTDVYMSLQKNEYPLVICFNFNSLVLVIDVIVFMTVLFFLSFLIYSIDHYHRLLSLT